jgi:hypothetical protein
VNEDTDGSTGSRWEPGQRPAKTQAADRAPTVVLSAGQASPGDGGLQQRLEAYLKAQGSEQPPQSMEGQSP